MQGEKNGGSKKEVRNYRPIAIINVICKLFMRLIRDSIIDGWKRVVCWVMYIFFRRGRNKI